MWSNRPSLSMMASRVPVRIEQLLVRDNCDAAPRNVTCMLTRNPLQSLRDVRINPATEYTEYDNQGSVCARLRRVTPYGDVKGTTYRVRPSNRRGRRFARRAMSRLNSNMTKL